MAASRALGEMSVFLRREENEKPENLNVRRAREKYQGAPRPTRTRPTEGAVFELYRVPAPCRVSWFDL